MIDLYIGDSKDSKKKIDVDDNIEIVRQVMDIFDISTRVVDYSKSIKAPKTAKNRIIFQGLGFSDSNFPYQRSYADAYSSGILLMRNAYVKVKNVNQSYNFNLISESKEIWKLIQNDTLGVLDLSESDHTKTASKLKEFWETGVTDDSIYHYFFADYGGKLPENNTVFGKYLIPSYRISYLVDQINEKYNTNIIIPEILNKTFITYSDANELEDTGDTSVWVKEYSEATFVQDLEKWIAPDAGRYRVIITGTIYAGYGWQNTDVPVVKFGDFDQRIIFPANQVYDKIYYDVNLSIPYKDIGKSSQLIIYDRYGQGKRWYFKGKIEVFRSAINVSGNVAFKDYKISDLLKEIIYQSGSIPIKNPSNDTYEFVTLKEIFLNEPEDWSDYFNEEEDETFIIGNYAQNNWFRYKYEDAEDSNKDGVIKIDNTNLETNVDVIKSTLYNTPVNPTKVNIGGTDISVQQYQLWQRSSEQVDGVFQEKYQPLSGRMFLLTGLEKEVSNFTIDTYGTETATTNKITIANNEDYNFQKVIQNRYVEYSNILQRAKVRTATFKIPLLVFANFDFKRRIYVKQLGSFFIINKMTYKTQSLMKIELIKADNKIINSDPNPIRKFLQLEYSF